MKRICRGSGVFAAGCCSPKSGGLPQTSIDSGAGLRSGTSLAHTVLLDGKSFSHQMRQEYGHGLFEAHGDVDETMVESGSIVKWTREQYNNAYNPEGDFGGRS